MAAIRMKRLVKRYGDVTVVPGIDLEIRDQEFVVFVGPSGCGKSTLLRVIAGLEPIDSGELYIGDKLVNDVPPARRDIAMVFQDYALYPHMTVYGNMAFGLEMRSMPKDEIDRRVQRAAALLHIEPLLKRKPMALSGGQRQRVAMGRAMVRNPQVFLFDEPLSNLDAKLRGEVRTEIKALAQKLQTTMVFVTHDQVEAMTMADRIVVLKAGVVQQFGTPEEVYKTPANQFVAGFIGSPRMNFIEVTVEEAGADRVAVKDEAGRRYEAAVSGEGLKPGDAAVLGIRPDHLDIVGDGGVPVTVQAIEQLGGESYLYCETESGARLTAHISGQTAVKRGDTAHAVFRPEFTHLFRKDDGRAQARTRVGEAV